MGLKGAPVEGVFEGTKIRIESHSALVGGFFRLFLNDEAVDEGPCTLTETAVLRAALPGSDNKRFVTARVTMKWKDTQYAVEVDGTAVEMSPSKS